MVRCFGKCVRFGKGPHNKVPWRFNVGVYPPTPMVGVLLRVPAGLSFLVVLCRVED